MYGLHLGDLIFRKGDVDDKSIYIIRKGKVDIFLEIEKMNAPETIFKTLKEGDSFEEMSFFCDKERSCCARSIDFTSAYMIKKEDFMKLLKRFPRVRNSVKLILIYIFMKIIRIYLLMSCL